MKKITISSKKQFFGNLIFVVNVLQYWCCKDKHNSIDCANLFGQNNNLYEYCCHGLDYSAHQAIITVTIFQQGWRISNYHKYINYLGGTL